MQLRSDGSGSSTVNLNQFVLRFDDLEAATTAYAALREQATTCSYTALALQADSGNPAAPWPCCDVGFLGFEEAFMAAFRPRPPSG